ncbi:MAG TPA: response regulator [Longimicrobium sp.]|nr:response regulator [Longimicrobium sp.]
MSAEGAGYVLVVDDIAEQRDIYEAMFTHAGLRVLEAKDGETAVSLARAHLPDVVLLDVCLPDVDGYEVIRRLKADERTSGISIVLLTACALPGDAAARDADYAEFLVKPIQPRDALAAVQRQLLAMQR